MNDFSANLYKFGLFYFLESLQKEFLMGIALWQSQVILSSRKNQTARYSQQVFVKCLHSYRFPLFGQTKAFEPIGQVVTEEDEVEMYLICQEAAGWNIAQRESFFEFSDIQLASGSGFVKTPYCFWFQYEIGNNGMVKIVFEFPERELVFFFFALGFGTTNHNEAMRLLPIVWLVSKGRCLPTVFLESMITKALNLLLDRFGHFGYDYVTNLFLLERFEELVVEESRVGSYADTVEVFGNLLLADRPKCPSSSCRVSISWAQNPTPSIPAVSLETNQGMITGPSGFFGIVSYLGLFDFPAENRKNCRIQIEDETRAWFGKGKHLFAQEVVDTHDSFQFFRGNTFQEFPQGGRLGKIFQTQKAFETTVVLKNLGVVDALDSGDHTVNQRQYHFCGLIQAGLPLPWNIPLQETPQIQFSAKPLKKQHTGEVRQTCFPEGELDISDAFGHLTITSLNGRFLSERNYMTYYTFLSSVFQIFLGRNLAFLALIQDDKYLIIEGAG